MVKASMITSMLLSDALLISVPPQLQQALAGDRAAHGAAVGEHRAVLEGDNSSSSRRKRTMEVCRSSVL